MKSESSALTLNHGMITMQKLTNHPTLRISVHVLLFLILFGYALNGEAAWAACPNDVNQDGDTDGSDLFHFVSHFDPAASLDRHALLLRRGACILYELYNLRKDDMGQWTAGSGAIWHLNQNEVRPEGYTSADAAGLPILPGLVRYEEVFGDPINNLEPGIHHALRITVSRIQRGYIRPASHSDGQADNDPNFPPMGLRMRLRADFNMADYAPPIQGILKAMQSYGVVIADTGSDLFLSGAHHDLWNDDQLRQLSRVHASDFEAVYTGPIIPY